MCVGDVLGKLRPKVLAYDEGEVWRRAWFARCGPVDVACEMQRSAIMVKRFSHES